VRRFIREGPWKRIWRRLRALPRAAPRHGRTYYLATRLLPAWKRRHVHALYGFTRYADEIVDRTEDAAAAERAARLAEWSDRFLAGLRGEPVDDPLLPAVLHTIAVFDLDRDDFATFLRSMAMDLTVTSYATYDDLLDYMEGSAAVIGTMMLPILGSADPAAAREPARQLGLAFQLTNFIRDVAEDLDRGRVYLPDERPGPVRRHPRRSRRDPVNPKIKDP
jgi:phytoene synthase